MKKTYLSTKCMAPFELFIFRVWAQPSIPSTFALPNLVSIFFLNELYYKYFGRIRKNSLHTHTYIYNKYTYCIFIMW